MTFQRQNKENDDNLIGKALEVTFYGIVLIAMQRFFEGRITGQSIMVATSFLAVIAAIKFIWPVQVFHKRALIQFACIGMCGIFSWWLIYTAENTRAAWYRLNVQKSRIESLVADAPAYIILSDSDGLITSTSNNIELLTGYKPQELIGQPLTVLMLDGQAARYQIAYDKAIALLRDPYSADQGWLFQGLIKVGLKHKNGNVVPIKMFSGGIRWSTDIQFKGDIDMFAIYLPVDPKDAMTPPTNLKYIEGRELQWVPLAPPVKSMVPIPQSLPIDKPH